MMNPSPKRTVYIAGLALALGLLAVGCGTSTSEKERRVPLRQLFLNYQVDGREEEEMVTVKLQFQVDGPESDAIHPGEDYSIFFDGQALSADTSRFSGVYFEYQSPLETFDGKHRIEIKRDGKTERADSFDFHPLRFLQPFPDTVTRRGFTLNLAGLEQDEALRLVISDTSFAGDGLNRLFPHQQGLIKVGEEELRGLAPGLLNVEMIREWERPLDKAPGAGGIFRLNYTLRREVFLTD